MLSKNNKILIGCLALLLAMSVGYALFSDTITVNGTATAKGEFDITTTCQAGIPNQFGTPESLGLASEGGYNNDSCSVVDDNVSINVGFEYPGARRWFTVKMTNTGSIAATLNIYDMEDKISGQLCTADNKEGNNAVCEEYLEIGGDGNQADKITAGWFDGMIFPAAFFDENGNLVPNEGTTSEFFDAENYIVTLKPNQTVVYLVDAYLSQYYTLKHFGNTGEFYAKRTLSLEYPWVQKSN